MYVCVCVRVCVLADSVARAAFDFRGKGGYWGRTGFWGRDCILVSFGLYFFTAGMQETSVV